MKSTGPLTSVPPFPRFPRRIAGSGIFFIIIIAALFALGVVCSAAPGLAQSPPEWAQDQQSSGLSPFVDESDGGTPVTVTGVLTILHADDFANKRSEFFYHLEDRETKKTYRLHFGKNPPGDLRTGATVTARGKAKGKDLILALDESGGASVQTVAAAAEAVAGEQRTLVMVANFLDVTVSCSILAVQDLMFTNASDQSVDDLFQETSLGTMWFTGDVVGPYTIDYSSTGTCDVSAWAAAAEAAARASGVNISVYDRKLYVLPQANSCGWAGLATIGGDPSQAWIFRCGIGDVYAHEIGHNLGMNHASTLTNGYGDTSDIMGYSGIGLRQVNAPHREQMGWLSAGQIAAVTNSGVYDISPLELDAQQTLTTKILKIAKNDTGEYYYLSYRKRIGFDNNLSFEYVDHLNVHSYKGDDSVSRTFFLDALADGESFVDSVNGITVTQMSHNNYYVTVEVQFDGADPTCTAAAPTVSLSPASQGSAAGTTLAYAISVSNTDSAACAASTFSLGRTIPSGWAGTLSPTTLTLGAGQTGQATLSVTSAAGAAPASYGLNVAVSDATQAVHTGSANATYVVQAPPPPPAGDTQPPTPPTGLSASLKGKGVKLSWGAATDNVGVSGYSVWRDGTRIGQVTGTSYADNAVTSGATYTYWVKAFDGAGNTSASSNQVTFAVNNAGGRPKR